MAINNAGLVTNAPEEQGTFDVLMGSVKAHLKFEYDSGRIKGTEYSSVYLGSLTEVLGQSVQFLLEREKRSIEIEILELEKLKSQAELDKLSKEILLVQENIELTKLQQPKLEAETELIGRKSDTELIQQTVLGAQRPKLEAETELIGRKSSTELIQQTVLEAQRPKLEAETQLIERKSGTELIQQTVLGAQECKLKAEFDLLVEQKSKTSTEIGFIAQKKVTEQAQTSSSGVDPASTMGRQAGLYGAQTDGFKRDSEQKTAKLMIESWQVRRTTDETGTSANSSNKLRDSDVGRAVDKLLSGVSA